MAADARPYKSKEQDGNGNEIILRDQQLVEQSSQTTMASTEYFEIVDVDGRMAKIPKDNMISVVREALGSLLNGLADQTTVAKFLTLNGNTLGASAAATAASVLGGIFSLHTSGELVISANSSTTFSMPRYGLLFIMEYGSLGAYGIFGVNGSTITKLQGLHYGESGSGDPFTLSINNGNYVLQSSRTGITKHYVMGFVHI